MAYEDLLKRLRAQQPTANAPKPQMQPINHQATSINYSIPMEADPAQLRGAADLAKQYGNINYDEDSIYNIFKGAVDSQYDAKQAGYDRSANDYYNRLGFTQQAMTDAMGTEKMQSGAAAGMSKANQLSAMLGLSQQSTQDATALTREQRALIDERTAAEYQARLDAMQTAQERKQFLAQIDAQLHANDTQYAIGRMASDAQIGAANTAASAQGRMADQQYNAALENARYNLAGQQYVADQNLAGQNFATLGSAASYGYSSDQNLRGSMYNADQSLAGTKYNADSNAAASRYNADSNLAASRAQAGATIRAAEAQAASYNYQAQLGYNAQLAGYDAAQTQQLMANQASVTNTLLANGFTIEDTEAFVNAWFPAPGNASTTSSSATNTNRSSTPPRGSSTGGTSRMQLR